jgi:3-deoxy-manno-octulosonate cytidylyltransferase (CMP-KDO synthetase)
MTNVVLIPARMAATRLPGKPLADILGEPMIVHVWRRGMEAAVGPVFVATDSQDVFDAVKRVGGEAVMTREDHASGSDRIFEALKKIDSQAEISSIINLQGDLPIIDPAHIARCAAALNQPDAEIATLAAEITEPSEVVDPNVVKVVGTPSGEGSLRALYFTRASAPYGAGPFYHHIGLYAYKRAALERFVALPPSALEKREKLEQLRALEAGMRIDVAVVKGVPLGVDSAADLESARRLLTAKARIGAGALNGGSRTFT